MRQSHITFKQFNLTVNNKKFRSNRLQFQPSFIVKLLFITVLICNRVERVLGLLGNKENFSNLVIYSLSVLTSCQFTNEPNREISRGVFQNRGVWGQAFPPLPSPSPFQFFCSRSNFPAITRLETLTTQLATQVTLKLMLETPLWKQLLSLTMKGGGGRGEEGSHHESCVSRVTNQIFTFSRLLK